VLGSIRPSFFLLPLRQGKKLGVPIYKEKLNRQNGVPYKLAIGKMNGLLSKSSNTMALPLGQKTGPGAIAPLYILNYIIRLQTVVKIITNKTTRALNLLAKQLHM
jgi:hypothetical protein